MPTKNIASRQNVSETDPASPSSPQAGGAVLPPEALIARAQRGDQRALDKLLEAARPRMMAVALRLLRDRDEAEDVVQEAMMKVCRYIGRFEGRASFSTWLHRIATNAAVDRLRLRRHLLLGARPDNDTGECAPTIEGVDERTPESELGQAQSDAVVRGAIGRLSLTHQQVLVLREFDGESYQQIARSAKCPVGTVMSRLHHARRKLTEELAQELDDVGIEAA